MGVSVERDPSESIGNIQFAHVHVSIQKRMRVVYIIDMYTRLCFFRYDCWSASCACTKNKTGMYFWPIFCCKSLEKTDLVIT